MDGQANLGTNLRHSAPYGMYKLHCGLEIIQRVNMMHEYKARPCPKFLNQAFTRHTSCTKILRSRTPEHNAVQTDCRCRRA